ncbi:MAG: HEAT repeat domain-containing protein [Planctomycetales bacterium]|nr:HEAT repeat domain-containing protein [Planctomycetales bacterium]
MKFLQRICLGLLPLIALVPNAASEEAICRYCRDGGSHLMPLGMELEGKYQYAPDRQVDVLHIKLDVTPDFDARTVSGVASITAKPISKPVEILRLDAIDLQVQKVVCNQIAVSDFVSSRDALQVAFADAVPIGTEFTVEIHYSAQPNAGLYFRTAEMGYPKEDTHIWTQGETHEARHWFPCFDYPNERSSTEVICHVPKEMRVLSNGKRLGEQIDSNGLKAVHWLQEKPHANYLICLVAGHLEKLEKRHRDIPLGFYTQPTLSKYAENSFRDTPEIMAFFEQEIGIDFPWVKYDQVTIRDFTAGGMENTTLTTLTHGTIFSKATENIRTTRRLDAHEMAHQWFGDYVTCKDWSHLWLNEGFATYYTHLFEGHKFGQDAMLYGLYKDATDQILTQDKDSKPIVYNGYKNAMQQFDYRSYPKGSWVLHMLRSQLGPDLYRKCIQSYLQQHALTSVVSDDLRQVIETHSGRPMDRFFDQWLYHPRHPDLKITYKWMPKEKLAKVTIKQTQPLSDDVVLYQFPTKLRFRVGDESVDHEIEVTEVEEDFYVPLSEKPTIVRFDPEYTVLATISFDKPNDLLKPQIKNADDMIGRLLACVALGDRKTHESAELLAERLNNDPFFGVRIAAATALGKHDNDESIRILQDSWKSQTDARVRIEVVRRMLKRFDPQTLETAIEVLQSESNPAILVAAVDVLGRFHGASSQEMLMNLLESESFDNEIAGAAISAIGKLNVPELTAPLLSVLQKRHQDFSSRDFGRGLVTLAKTAKTLDDKTDVFEFLSAQTGDLRSSVKASALDALGKLGDKRAESIIDSFTQSGDQRVANAAKRAIGELNDSKPMVASEIIELRKMVTDMKRATEKLESELKELKDQASVGTDKN